MRPWLTPPPVTVPAALAAAVGGHPLVAEMLARRGFTDPAAALAFLDPARYTPAAASELPGMARAVTRLGRALRTGEPICVWGDFDVDGQTATALLVSALRDLGGRVTYHVPLRETEGHGVSLPALKGIIAGGARLILTCDTGIAAHEAVAYARTQRVDVIITDHHDPPPTLPDAVAVINPKLLHHAAPGGSETRQEQASSVTLSAAAQPVTLSAAARRVSPLADLPGVGVAYKLAEALYAAARRPGEAEKHLDLTALGIVADLALQRGDTRYLLQRGLAALRRAERTGLRVMLEAADLLPAHLSEEHIGFVLGPRLNAAGRLADAGPCVELLTTGDETRARIIAADLEALNGRRKLLCDQVEAGAEAQIAADPALLEHAALVLSSPHWPAGVIGIVASRLVERYGKPAILIAAPPGGIGRASARSVAGINITAAIAEHADMLTNFGGHPMAAGFGILPERIPDFRRALSRSVRTMEAGLPAAAGLPVDGLLPLSQLSLALVDDLGRLAPFGPGNPPLTLVAERVRVLTTRPVGRGEERRLLLAADEAGEQRQVIWWGGGNEEAPEGLIDLAYVARASTYRGARDLQVEWVAWRPAAGVEAEVKADVKVEVVDHRGADDPRRVLAELAAGGDVAIWREGDATCGIPGHDRRTLPRAETLVIWTSPPGPAELRAALAQVRPARVCLFAEDPGTDRPEAFLRRLAGLVKHALAAREGRAPLAALAAATAQRAATVRLGLAWLASQGHVQVIAELNGEVQLAAGLGVPAGPAETAQAAARVKAALKESAAYRAYYRGAEAMLISGE